MVLRSMSPTTKPTSASGGGSPANASPSPTGGNKVGWDAESLPSPPFGTPTGSPYRPAFDASTIAAHGEEPEERGGGPPALALPSTPRFDAVAGQSVDAGKAEGKLGSDRKFVAATASLSPPPCAGDVTAAPSEEGRTSEEDSQHTVDACGDGNVSSGESSSGSQADKGSSHEQDTFSEALLAPSSSRGAVSSHQRKPHHSVLSPALSMQPPSASTTPSVSPTHANQNRRRASTYASGISGSNMGPSGFETPGGSPWPSSARSRATALPADGGGIGGHGLSAAAKSGVMKAVASGANPRNMRRLPSNERGAEWKGPQSLGGGVATVGEGAALSPVSAAISLSPRAPTNCSSPRPVSPRLVGTGSPRLPYPEALEWWTELELSPTKVDMPGLQRWRDSRRPSTLPTSSSRDGMGVGPQAGGVGATGYSTHLNHSLYRQRANDLRSAAASTSEDVVASEHGADGLSPLRPSKLSRSYITRLAAAAEEARLMTPSSARHPPHAHGVHRSESSGSTSVVAAVAAAAAAGGGVGTDRMEVSVEAFARAGEDRIRRLEAENLRLRFRVADLEGQVSVMEDELDRRGGRADPWPDSSPRSGGDSKRYWRGESGTQGGSGDESRGGGGNGDGREGDSRRREVSEPILSPRGRGYLARLVAEVCSELEESKRVVPKETVVSSGSIPRSERLCKVLPKVMETAIKGVRDLDEQVFEQMMQVASERIPVSAPTPPPGTPARRLSSCVVARDGGTEFFAQSPAPGRPASFFRLGEPHTPTQGIAKSLAFPSWTGGTTPRAAPARHTPQQADPSSERRKGLGGTWGVGRGGNDATKSSDTPNRWTGEWWAAFTPTSSSNNSNKSSRAAGGTDPGAVPALPPPPRAVENPNIFSFEGSAEEVLRYTIVAKSYLIRSKSKRHGEGGPSPTKVVKSPGGTPRIVADGDDNDMRIATKELLDLKTRYMTATQHWLKTDIVNDEELRMIRAQVFEAIQRKRSELHREAAAVLRAERLNGMRSGSSGNLLANANSNASSNTVPENDPGTTGCTEEEAKRTINMLAGTAELLRFSRLLLLLNDAIAVSTAPGGAVAASGSGSASGSAGGSEGSETDKAAGAGAVGKTVVGAGGAAVMRMVPRMIPATVPEVPADQGVAGISDRGVEMTPETAPGSESETESTSDSTRDTARDSFTGRPSDSVASEARASRESSESTGPLIGLGSALAAMQTPSRGRGGKGRSSSSPPLRPKIRSIDICPE